MIKKLVQMLKSALAPIKKMMSSKYGAMFLKALLIVYIAFIAVKMPRFVARALNNKFVRLVILFAIVYAGLKDPVMALLIAIAFVVSMMTLNKMQSIDSVQDLFHSAVDIPQSLANDIIDGGQDIVTDAVDVAVDSVGDVVGVTNDVIDGAQSLANNVLDKAQDMIQDIASGVTSPSTGEIENFKMEDRTLDVAVPDMGTLGGLSGFDPDAEEQALISQ